MDHPGSGAGDLVASRKDNQFGGLGRLQAKRSKIAVTGVIAQIRFSKLATFNVRTLTSRWRRLELASWAESHNCELRTLAQDRDQWSQLVVNCNSIYLLRACLVHACNDVMRSN